MLCFCYDVQDNVFVTVVASVQYRAHLETAEDAFYKLTNPREQIKSYVFDGKCTKLYGKKNYITVIPCVIRLKFLTPNHNFCLLFVTVVRASVPRMILDDVFEQKNEIAKTVAEELEKVLLYYGTICLTSS
jgi:hypothetical protein